MKIYKKIKKAANRYKLTAWAYQYIFRDPEPKEYPKQPASKEEKMVNPYLKYKGSVIRDIRIIVYDPFGRNMIDTLPGQTNWIEKVGNGLHRTSRKRVIRNRLLFKTFDKVNPIAISESERVLRQSDFVNDARIFIQPLNQKKDTVSLTVVVLDKWTISVPVDINTGTSFIILRDRNLLGWGHTLQQYGSYTLSNKTTELNGLYAISNIGRSFVSSAVNYRINTSLSQVGISFDRPFYSPLAKWAGGLSFEKTWTHPSYTDTIQQKEIKALVDYYNYDVWLGKNFKLSKRRTIFNQSTNILLGSRYYGTLYEHKLPAEQDKDNLNANTSVYLGNVGFAVQQYYKDQFIYRFGYNEDVPEGIITQYIYGVLFKEGYRPKYYSGFEFARAKRFKRIGYLTGTLSYGIFFNDETANEETYNIAVNYFSNLIKGGPWYFRQFLNYKFVCGINKQPYETITLGSQEMYGFSAGTLSGTTKMIMNFESVAYAPWHIIGFRFAPVILAGYGMLGDNQRSVLNSKIWQAYSVGFMVRNENLITSTFQITVGLYPSSPDQGKTVFKYNPVANFTLRVRGFSVGKPNLINYQ